MYNVCTIMYTHIRSQASDWNCCVKRLFVCAQQSTSLIVHIMIREREECTEREREMERVYREREGECFEIEGVCREIESVCKGSVCLERERGESVQRERERDGKCAQTEGRSVF